MLAKLFGLLIQTLLKQPRLRRRLSFELQQNYFADLEMSVPLGFALKCPIYDWPYWYSFTEIFMQQEYAEAFNKISLPDRFLDIGCHAGYFALYILWLKRKQNPQATCSALLVDADSRIKPAVERLIQLNKLQGQLSFNHAAISATPGKQNFYQRQHMDSSLQSDGTNAKPSLINVVNPERILELFAPPYDLIKLDIEGAEFDFLTNYQSVYKHSKYLLLEWHSWQSGGGGRKQLEEVLSANGFAQIAEVLPANEVSLHGNIEHCGVTLYQQMKSAL